MKSSFVLLLLAFVIGSAFAEETKPVYGIDGRTEEYQIAPSLFKTLGSKTGAMIFSDDLDEDDFGNFDLLNAIPTLQTAEDLCDGEPFLNQPTAAFCSGTLIAPNLFLTAGHCVQSKGAPPDDLTNVRVVFNYVMKDVNSVNSQFLATEVYSINKVQYGINDGVIDIAVLELSSDVVGITPVTQFGYFNEVFKDDNIAMIGNPSGIPRKYDDGVVVGFDNTIFQFLTDVDAYHGGSGSGIFNVAGELIAILISGSEDYLFNPAENCYVDYDCINFDGGTDNICDGETIQSICILPSSFGVPSCDAIRPSVSPSFSITPTKSTAPSATSVASSTPVISTTPSATRTPNISSPSSSRAPFTNSGDSSSSSSGSTDSSGDSSDNSTDDSETSSASSLLSCLFCYFLIVILII